MKKLLLKIKNIRFARFVFADIYRILSIFLLTLIQIPGMIFWGAVWFEVDMDLPHFNYKQFLESDIFRALLLTSFLYSIGLLISEKLKIRMNVLLHLVIPQLEYSLMEENHIKKRYKRSPRYWLKIVS